MNADERAREITYRAQSKIDAQIERGTSTLVAVTLPTGQLIIEITQAIAEARTAALREAAEAAHKISKQYYEPIKRGEILDGDCNRMGAEVGAEIVLAILALIDNPDRDGK